MTQWRHGIFIDQKSYNHNTKKSATGLLISSAKLLTVSPVSYTCQVATKVGEKGNFVRETVHEIEDGQRKRWLIWLMTTRFALVVTLAVYFESFISIRSIRETEDAHLA